MDKRFLRQSQLPEVGQFGQQEIARAKVLIVGMGGLGCPAAQYLIAAGVGHLGIVDGDRVDATNLHRQILYTDKDVGQPKVEIAAERLRLMSPNVEIQSYFHPITAENVESILNPYDIVLDCTDNFETKYLINDSCLISRKTLITASATGFEANLMVIDGEGPCLRCLYPQVNSAEVGNCNLSGILGAFVGIVGSWQAAEALKTVLVRTSRNRHLANPIGKVLFFDFYTSKLRVTSLKKNADCRCANPIGKLEHAKHESLYVTMDQMSSFDNYVLVDVRTDEERGGDFTDEFQNIESIHRPHHRIISGEFDQDHWPSNKKYILFCSMGKRSALAAQWLRDHGVKTVYSIRRS